MKRKPLFVSILIGLLCLSLLAGCGGGGNADSKYVGKYICVVGEALGMTMTGEDLNGFELELKEGGKAVFTIDGESKNIKWTNDDTNITLKISGQDVVGEIGTDSIIFINLLNMGMDLTFAKEGTEAANPVHYLSGNDKLMIGTWKSYAVSDVLDEDASALVDPTALIMTFSADHTAEISYLGENLGTQMWSLLSDFGSFDNSDLNITWYIEGEEIKATYIDDDDYFIFTCKK